MKKKLPKHLQRKMPFTPYKNPNNLLSNWLSDISSESENLQRLLKHYNIPKNKPNRWLSLSRCLAHDYIGGFSTSKPTGRKTTWDFYTKVVFLSEITTLTRKKITIKDACAQVKKKYQHKTLEKRFSQYNSTKDRHIGPLKKAFLKSLSNKKLTKKELNAIFLNFITNLFTLLLKDKKTPSKLTELQVGMLNTAYLESIGSPRTKSLSKFVSYLSTEIYLS